MFFRNKNNKNKTDLLQIILGILNGKTILHLVFFIWFVVKLFRLELIYGLGLSHIGYVQLIFISFSLIIPCIVLSRIIKNVYFDLLLYNSSPLIVLLIKQMVNPEKYNLSDITVGYWLLIIYVCVPVIGLLLYYDIFYVSSKREHWSLETTNKKVWVIGSYDDISFPPGKYSNTLQLNPDLSKSYAHLVLSGAIPQETETANGKVYDYLLMYGGVPWIRTDSAGTFYKESYLKTRHTQSLRLAPSFSSELGFTLFNDFGYNKGVQFKLEQLASHPRDESCVDALVATIMPIFFGVDRGYGYNPQARDSHINISNLGKIDFLVDYNNKAVLIIEDKVIKGNSWLHACYHA